MNIPNELSVASGGKFRLEIKIPDTYPFNPPKVITMINILKPGVYFLKNHYFSALEVCLKKKIGFYLLN